MFPIPQLLHIYSVAICTLSSNIWKSLLLMTFISFFVPISNALLIYFFLQLPVEYVSCRRFAPRCLKAEYLFSFIKKLVHFTHKFGSQTCVSVCMRARIMYPFFKVLYACQICKLLGMPINKPDITYSKKGKCLQAIKIN